MGFYSFTYIFISFEKYGGPAGVRTQDLRLKRALLYRLSYRSKPFVFMTREIIYKNLILSNVFLTFFVFLFVFLSKMSILWSKFSYYIHIFDTKTKGVRFFNFSLFFMKILFARIFKNSSEYPRVSR